MRLIGFCIACWLAFGTAAQGATPPGNLRASEAPTLQSEAVIAAAMRIKGALVRLQPCPSVDVARYAIGLAAQGVKLEILLLALELSQDDEDLCRGARRGLARAMEDARLALAALGPTGATEGVPPPSGPPPGGSTSRRGIGFGSSFGGTPGGPGGSGYRPKG